MENNKEEKEFEDFINESEKDYSNKILYLSTNNNDNLKVAKLRSLIYGIIITTLGVIIFISEFFFHFDIEYLLDYYVSVAMILDIVLGISLIIRSRELKNLIKANKLLNLVNQKFYIDNNEIKYKRTISILRMIQVISIPLNISLITCYLMIKEYDLEKYNSLDKFVFYFTLILIFLLILSCIMSLISIENEEELYENKTISDKKSGE